MIIGVPRERKTLEKRVAITPDGAGELVKNGHTVLVETNAGAGSFFENEQYTAAGATIISSLEEVWAKAELVVKVKEPDESEFKFFRPGLALFDYLHLASLPKVAAELVKSGVRSLAYELVQLPDHRLPLLEPMSEVAGKLSVLNGANHLLSQNGGRGVLLGGTIGTPRATVVIVGAGISGRAACEIAVGMGAEVTVIDRNYKKLEYLKDIYGTRISTLFSNRATLEREAAKADLLIGAVLVPGAAAPKLFRREMIAGMKRGSVFVDISIDQGGCAETSKPTSLDKPTYVEEDVIHYGVTNMPAQTPRTSTLALTAATLPYITRLADHGLTNALQQFPELKLSVNTFDGKLTNLAVSQAVGIKFDPL